MPLFACTRCNCVEDTALSHYWSARLWEKSPLCSACDPTLGKWHDEFPRESAQGWITDGDGFLLDKRSVESWLGQPVALFGKELFCKDLFGRQEQETPEGSAAVRAHILSLNHSSLAVRDQPPA
ncbi:MAG TPA: hypothetical protein VKW08_07430 [Xanthobacteraceae bacterium]|jgi:hypothetical protein|nr:hypothetical protein [Xanthobacteraceae bacterium]